MDWFALMGIIGIVQLFTGPRWRPAQMGLISKNKPGNAIREYLPDTHILTSQYTSRVLFDAWPVSVHLNIDELRLFSDNE
jgi:hypothetical protein